MFGPKEIMYRCRLKAHSIYTYQCGFGRMCAIIFEFDRSVHIGGDLTVQWRGGVACAMFFDLGTTCHVLPVLPDVMFPTSPSYGVMLGGKPSPLV